MRAGAAAPQGAAAFRARLLDHVQRHSAGTGEGHATAPFRRHTCGHACDEEVRPLRPLAAQRSMAASSGACNVTGRCHLSGDTRGCGQLGKWTGALILATSRP